jgi:hypothetical protein
MQPKFFLFVFFLALTFFVVSSCREKDHEAAIRALIKEGAVRAEKHDIDGILRLASEDLKVLPGEIDRREVRRILWLAFRHYGDLRVIYPQPEVDLEKNKDQASVQFPFLIVKKDQSFPKLVELFNEPQEWLREVGERADLYRLKLRLSARSGEWMVSEAHLERFTGLGFGD